MCSMCFTVGITRIETCKVSHIYDKSFTVDHAKDRCLLAPTSQSGLAYRLVAASFTKYYFAGLSHSRFSQRTTMP